MSGTRKSITMLSSTESRMEVVGDPIKADSYFGYTDGMHTVQVTYHNFVGGFGIQGTLSLNPSEEDWFYIKLHRGHDVGLMPVINYPKDPTRPTGTGSAMASHVGDTGTESFTFYGNFTFIRAVATRKFLSPMPIVPANGTWTLGQIDRVLICL